MKVKLFQVNNVDGDPIGQPWSVGSYGLDGEIYANFLTTRWYEILKQSN